MGGKFLNAPATFSRTSWAAPSISRSNLNVEVMLAEPSDARLIISSRPLTDEIASSSGKTTDEVISSGLAPGKLTLTLTVAGSALGNKSTPNDRKEKMPSVTKNAINITANTGRSTQTSAIFIDGP